VRVGIIPEHLLERVALWLGAIPTPIVQTFPPIVFARCVIAATQLGIFTALAEGVASADEIAARCHTQPRPTRLLLDALVALGYASYRAGCYGLAPAARRWLDPVRPGNVQDYLAFTAVQWEWLSHLEAFIKTDTPLIFHHDLAPAEWERYMLGMYSIARLTLPEVLWRARLPRHARTLLDLGGGHGLAAIQWCRRRPTLRADIVDLAAALLATPPLPSDVAPRLRRIAGDALTSDLGTACYDVVYTANLMHHFSAAQNQCLAQRIARALRPGGIWIVQDGIRDTGNHISQASALGALYFALTSASGFWTFDDFATWQRAAGLRPRRPIRLLTAPGQGIQIATREGGFRGASP
jgi:SAM-dependent methyltransferase